MERHEKCRGQPALWLEYDLLDVIGKGSFGVVWSCRERSSGRLFACKTMRKDEKTHRMVAAEVRHVALLSHHRNIVRVFGSFESKHWMFLVMELCARGDLLSFINRTHGLDESTAAGLFRDVVAAVAFCHRHGVVHRDIKPENVLLAAGGGEDGGAAYGASPLTAKLGDFGLAKRLRKGERAVGFAGSYPYVAPEVAALEHYDWSADVWSLGVLLFSMLAGSVPEFQQHRGGGWRRKGASAARFRFDPSSSFSSLAWAAVSPAAKALITRMLAARPQDRPTATAILGDPWFQQAAAAAPPPQQQAGTADTSVAAFWRPWFLPGWAAAADDSWQDGGALSPSTSGGAEAAGSSAASSSASSLMGSPLTAAEPGRQAGGTAPRTPPLPRSPMSCRQRSPPNGHQLPPIGALAPHADTWARVPVAPQPPAEGALPASCPLTEADASWRMSGVGGDLVGGGEEEGRCRERWALPMAAVRRGNGAAAGGGSGGGVDLRVAGGDLDHRRGQGGACSGWESLWPAKLWEWGMQGARGREQLDNRDRGVREAGGNDCEALWVAMQVAWETRLVGAG